MIKKKWNILTIVLVLCLVLPSIVRSNQIVFVISQEGGWSDDFNDGNIDGWSFHGWDESTWEERPGNFTADDYTLRAYDNQWSNAYRESNVANGSWAFDVECVPTPLNHFYVAFVSGPTTSVDMIPREYGLMIVTGEFSAWNHTFVLYQRVEDSAYIIPLGTYEVDEVSGWYHINITRDLNCIFTVAFNGTTEISGVTATAYNSSTIFSFYTNAGPAIDNIVVTPYSETTSTTTSTTTTSTTATSTTTNGESIDMTLFLIAGGGIAVVVILVIIVKSKK
ncbi:MAG: hypothetical protein ACW99U_00160 [Candidatus Thorarchaeota archaeon]|jgi:hypothetical protein